MKGKVRMSKKTFDSVVESICSYLQHLAHRNHWQNDCLNGREIIVSDEPVYPDITDNSESITIYGSEYVPDNIHDGSIKAYIVIKMVQHKSAFYIARFEVIILDREYLSGRAFLIYKGKILAPEERLANEDLSDFWKVDCAANLDAMFHEYDKVASFYELPQIFFPKEKANI
jgi:uncharacterized FlgJ-related protein